MPYVFLTGATGLLGRYLIKDLTGAGVSLAVLVRPSRRATTQHRLENVMCYWDGVLGRSLPRPVVLEGDITEPDLGLDARGMRWVAENCDTMLHNAASLTFQSTSRESEPWRSNVEGVRHVLEMCRNAGIRRFHHVSTAYVCGLRQGQILESELDVGQKMSNDYEQSKLQAETMVRSAEFLDSLTVHRPAIIVGDSTNGYTSTYHGFYAPLQAIFTMSQRETDPSATGHFGVSARFCLSGHETKNLVPVDWVSAVMSHIITHPEHHGKTYHLTPLHPVTARLLGDVYEEAIGFYGVRLEGGGQPLNGLSEYEQLFCDLIRLYSSYWKDDPTFDSTNTRAAAPHLPCPHVDRRMLLKMAEYATRVNFTSPRARPVEPKFDVSATLEPLLEAAQSSETVPRGALRLGLRVTGHGGGDWSLIVKGNELTSADVGIHPKCTAVVECDVDAFGALTRGDAAVETALARGDIALRGDASARPQIITAFRHLAEFDQARALAASGEARALASN